jgi:hypothetical protein
VVEASSGCTATFWALIPGHGYRVESMKITVNGTFGSFTTEDYNSRPSKDG